MPAILWAEAGDVPKEDFLDRLVEQLEGRVLRAFVFGSYGTPYFAPGSDVDLILIIDTDLPFVERPSLFNDLYSLYPRLDILVYTADELAEQLEAATGFWASVKQTLRELPMRHT